MFKFTKLNYIKKEGKIIMILFTIAGRYYDNAAINHFI